MTATPPPATQDTHPAPPPAAATATVPHQNSTRPVSRARTFTGWVAQVCREDPGARSALRSGLRKDLDSVQRMHRLVAPWLPEQRSKDVERAYYTVAAMIAAQPRSALKAAAGDADDDSVRPGGREPSGGTSRRPRSSLGTSFAIAVTEGPGREKEMRAGTAESRLNLLTRQSVNGLHRHLPASVGYLRSVGVEVDWAQLLEDLGNWRARSGRISRTWLQDFYRLRSRDSAQQADAADERELGAPPAPASS
ncbi:type I-E CRISPR-associated protein Cse2/CasB [Streptomyces baarnensis]|uniref:type I-E CRISPR-associated protein Cse2/CasB n=1 Tax=Streptomyces TaxID=1883 RepID=UPI0029B05CEC|nr:type I-E CRISPR-associated protein Cse2/CasB [Streptomyces sp. ME02-6979.5a]MDX3342728.1 type I-E CRISPR-associated protein Cse2/CasB [Streptomyces sp. ME02-6979.5a]